MPEKQDLNKYINRLKRLKQFKDKSIEELTELAIKKFEEKELKKEPNKKITADFEDDWSADDKKIGNKLYQEYIEKYPDASRTDLASLRTLVKLEVWGIRIQEKINSFLTTNAENTQTYIPKDLLHSYHNNLEQITALKEKIGIYRKEDVKNDGYETLMSLFNKVKDYQKIHKTKSKPCPHCSKMILFSVTEDVLYSEIKNNPYFKDKILWNEPLLKLVINKKITNQEAADVLETTAQYIDRCIERLKTQISNRDA